MKRALIVLSPQNMPMEQPFRNNYNYSNCYNSEAILKAGGMPIIPPFLNEAQAGELLASADGLFLTGGESVCPERYGEERLSFCGETDEKRDISDFALLGAALKLNKPVLCVCRGMQLANVYFGGSLYQDIYRQREGSLRHSCCRWPEYTRGESHSVRITEGSPLMDLLGKDSIMVNSLHRQGVKSLGQGLMPMALAPDGIIEGFYLPSDTQWLRAYQWHPEMLEDSREGRLIFEDFISACNNKMT